MPRKRRGGKAKKDGGAEAVAPPSKKEKKAQVKTLLTAAFEGDVSKVTDVHLHEPMQMGMNIVGFFSRGVGSVAGDFLSPNALGALMTALLATMAALNICLTKQLKPKGL